MVCGERQVSAVDKNAVVNPSVLVEVTSNSTEEYDRGEKLKHYLQCPSVQAVLVVSHRRPQITVFARGNDGGWLERDYQSGQRLSLEKPECELVIDDVYAGVDLDAVVS